MQKLDKWKKIKVHLDNCNCNSSNERHLLKDNLYTHAKYLSAPLAFSIYWVYSGFFKNFPLFLAFMISLTEKERLLER